MALKALLLRKKIDTKRRELEALQREDENFKKREEELTQAIDEAQTEEEQAGVEELAAEYESGVKDHNEKKAELEREISELEDELAAEEREQDTTPAAPEHKEREVERPMNTRNKVFRKMSREAQQEFVSREEVKNYLHEVRSCIRERRALTNVGLTVPTVMLGLLRENIEVYSKLYRHVNVRTLSGDGRLVVSGTVPEAVWTECCATLNELDLTFNDVEVGCWKVGGYFAVCNATLEDSDIDLAAELLIALGQAIGYALDKAILYGTGTRMPMGVVARLAQTERPADYPDTARTWVDLHTTNIKTIANTYQDDALFKQLALASGAAKGVYSRGEKVWVMNETTYTNLIANAMSIDASGAIVSGVNGMMPVIGGIIEVLNFIPDNVIIGGYFDLYLLAERGGQRFVTSEHVRFLQDQTVMKGTARYDGKPAIAEAFVAIGIEGVVPTAAMTFAPDTANPGE